jgi:transposase InsO family protein
MSLPRSTFYDKPATPTDDAEIVARMRAICDEFESYGYRRVGAALRHQGIVVNSKRVRRLMRVHDLQPRRRRRFVTTTDSDHDRPIFPDRAKGMVVRTSSGSPTSPTSRSRPASSIWPPSSMPGRAEWSVMRSAGRSMPD